ncbi:MAG: outer rane beta-barrel protein [Mucilaginibacter sp.]|nr:outer rane beta-barrel protein [Mucilaginibacter sp.]
MFRDTLQISVLGQGNNLNGTSFSYDDLGRQGGFNRGGGDTFYRGGLSASGGFGGIGFIGLGGLGNTGIQKVISSGVNINTDYGKKLKINLAYYYSHTHTDNNSINNKQQILADTDLVTNSINSSFNAGNAHNLSATVRWQPNDATQLTYNPTLIRTDNQSGNGSTVNSFSNFIPQIALTTNSGSNSNNSTQFQQTFTYHHQFKKKGESIDVSHSLQINPNDGIGYTINNLTSYTTELQSFLLNRNNNILNRNTDAKLGVAYRYTFSKKLTGSFGIADDYNHQVNNTITYDFDTATGQYDSFLQTLSSNLTRNLWTENVTTGLTYNFKPGMQAVVTANTQILQVNNKFDRGFADINQHFLTVLPNVDLNLGNYSLSYQSGFTLPYIGDMIPYTVVSSPLYAVTGNPDLKPTKRENYNFRYNNYNMKSQMYINAGLSLSEEQNSVFRHQTLDAVGATTSTPVNMDGRYTFSTNFIISKNFKKTNDFQLRMSTSVSAGKSHGYFEINNQGGYQNTYYVFFMQQLSLNWKDFISLDQSYVLNNSITTYTGVNYNNVANTTHTLNTHLIITGPKKVNLESTYTFKYNPMVSPGFQKTSNMVNLSLARELLKKDRGEIKISCYDILNQNISSFRYINANTITDTQAEVLRRYFMLTLQFKFNKTITK